MNAVDAAVATALTLLSPFAGAPNILSRRRNPSGGVRRRRSVVHRRRCRFRVSTTVFLLLETYQPVGAGHRTYGQGLGCRSVSLRYVSPTESVHIAPSTRPACATRARPGVSADRRWSNGTPSRYYLTMVRDLDDIAVVRRFNRTVTERIGLLEESFLGRNRPLGASRLLWEIGDQGADLQELRDRLGLDSGYVSRLVRRLEGDGLIAVDVDPDDRRRRRLHWTATGRDEVHELDRRSDVAAGALLDELPPKRRDRLLAALTEVERSLRATLVHIDVEDPRHPHVVTCFARYAQELDARFDGGFDAGISISANPEELTPPTGYSVVARLRGRPVGCGALKLHGDAPAELKRMWVDPSSRGLGIGQRVLDRLEALARETGVTVLHLETNRALTEAIAMYRSAGFVEVAPFNDEPYAHHWFEKILA